MKNTLDSCTVHRIIKNPNYASALGTTIDFVGQEIQISEYAVAELEKHNLSIGHISTLFRKLFNANLVIVPITTDDYRLAEILMSSYEDSGLHWEDAWILASALNYNSTLISCDKTLCKICSKFDHPCINPDEMGINNFNLKQNGIKIFWTKDGLFRGKRISKRQLLNDGWKMTDVGRENAKRRRRLF